MGGRVLTLQRQARELGRLRSGYTDTSGPKNRPVKSTTWIVTSPNEDYVNAAAALWGGTPEKWQPLGAGAAQWRVITATNAIDAILPPGDPMSQTMELWNKGGVALRCDGATNLLTDSPCVCRAKFGDDFHLQAKEQRCQITTRLSLILPAMPDIGVWRVETHGYYAANEIAATVDVIRGAVGDRAMVPVQARIEPRTKVSEGKTKQFPVIVLALRGVTAGQVLAGTADPSGEIASQARREVAGTNRSAIEAPTDAEKRDGKWDNIKNGDARKAADVAAEEVATSDLAFARAQDIADRAMQATTPEGIRALWSEAVTAGVMDVNVTVEDITAPLVGLLKNRGTALAGTPDPTAPAAPATPPTAPPAGAGPADGTTAPATASPAVERIWLQVMAAAGGFNPPWTTSQLEADFASCHGGSRPGQVSPEELRAYWGDLERRADREAADATEPAGVMDGQEVIDAELVPAGAPALDQPPF